MSQRFKDNSGREYEAVVTVATAIALKRAGVDLNRLGDDLLEQLMSDPELLVNALWIMVEDSAKALGVGQEQFARSLGGDTLEGAIDAMLEALTSFTRPSARTAFRNLIEKSNQAGEMLIAQMNAAAEQLTPEMILKSLSTVSSSPALPGSSPSN